jgi:hypothetical protein
MIGCLNVTGIAETWKRQAKICVPVDIGDNDGKIWQKNPILGLCNLVVNRARKRSNYIGELFPLFATSHNNAQSVTFATNHFSTWNFSSQHFFPFFPLSIRLALFQYM